MSVLKKLALFLAIAAVTNVAIVASLPQLINRFVMHKIAAQGVEHAQATNDPRPAAQKRIADMISRRGYNVALPAPRADASARTVVRPSPDLLYTVCVFDVSEHALRITAPVQDSYVSVAGFDADTNNFFAINDSQVLPGPDGRKSIDLVLARGDVANLPAGARVINAPSTKGLILFRSLITGDKDVQKLRDDYQVHQLCEPI